MNEEDNRVEIDDETSALLFRIAEAREDLPSVLAAAGMTLEMLKQWASKLPPSMRTSLLTELPSPGEVPTASSPNVKLIRPVRPQLFPAMAVRASQSKPKVHICTFGDIGHGKSTLTAALVARSVARFHTLPSLTTKTGRTGSQVTVETLTTGPQNGYESSARRYLHFDWTGREDVPKQFILGAAQVDGAIWVVSADTGVTPRAREQLSLIHQVGVPSVVVFINKIDSVTDRDLIDLLELEIREALARAEYSNSRVQIVRGSANVALRSGGTDSLSNEPIDELLDALDSTISDPSLAIDQPFLMSVEDVFSIAGRGTVCTGRVERGVVRMGDAVELVGLRADVQKSVVAGVEMFQQNELLLGKAGDNVGLLLRGVEKSDIERGMVLAAPGTITPISTFKCVAYFLSAAEGGRQSPWRTSDRPDFYFRTADVRGELMRFDSMNEIAPGETALLAVALERGVALEEHQAFAIRERGRTIGSGRVTEIRR